VEAQQPGPGGEVGGERATDPAAIDADALRERITKPAAPVSYPDSAADPLAAWIEESLGFEPGAQAADPPRRRRRPLTLPEATGLLAGQTGEAMLVPWKRSRSATLAT
jgi:hypothetical protein